MDPDCAICSAPAVAGCECEAKALNTAVREAEQRMMATFFSDVRLWVRNHAQDFILNYFSVLSSGRHAQHASHIDALTRHAAYFRQRPHPAEIARADAELKRGIDEDWRASVQRYPEVLEYFYSLVDWRLPADDDVAVRDPPLSALGGARKSGQRVRIMVGDERIPLTPLEERERRRDLGRRSMPPLPPGYVYPGAY
ncbi:MAG: hypothetical protein M1818_007117 [Claussenomyces sp. TS43310]|nr:MAG: hypothetical protein M1818_007117 [Claussenomyces sp. TS43310]